MPAFVADHTGRLKIQSSFLRPIHIGAALCEGSHRGPEPDDVGVNSISRSTAYADLRMHHHVRWNWEGKTEWLALMQYRRMYSLGTPLPNERRLWNLKQRAAATDVNEVHIEKSLTDEYVAFLARQSDQILKRELWSSDIICNRIVYPDISVEEQYIRSIVDLYPGQPAYVDAWYDLRKILEEKVGSSIVARCLDGNTGFINNCFITRWIHFLSYYDFLFEVLDRLSIYRPCYRLFGYLAERMMYPWLLRTKLRVRSKSIVFFG